MIKSKINVINVEYRKGKAELIRAQLKTIYGESQKIVAAYVSPKKNWTMEGRDHRVEDTIESL